MVKIAALAAVAALALAAPTEALPIDRRPMSRHHQHESLLQTGAGGECVGLDGSGDHLNYACKMFFKTQTKVNDCWYADIQMLRSASCGAKTKPVQDADSFTMKHRGGTASATSWWGAKIKWGNDDGPNILSENGLDTGALCMFSTEDFYKHLKKHGPFIISGKAMGVDAFGHVIVVYGVDKASDSIYVADSAWPLFKKSQKQSTDKLVKWMSASEGTCEETPVLASGPPSDTHPDYCA